MIWLCFCYNFVQCHHVCPITDTELKKAFTLLIFFLSLQLRNFIILKFEKTVIIFPVTFTLKIITTNDFLAGFVFLLKTY